MEPGPPALCPWSQGLGSPPTQPWATSVHRTLLLDVSKEHTRKHALFSDKQGLVWGGIGVVGAIIFWCNMRYMEILETLEFSRRDRLLAENGTFLHKKRRFSPGGEDPPWTPPGDFRFSFKTENF